MYTSHYRVTRWIGAPSLFFAFVRWYCHVHVEGLENVPQNGAFIIAANHSSHADSAVIYAILPPAQRRRLLAAAARDYFFENDARQFVSRSLFNAIPVARDAAIGEDPLRHPVRALREGYGLLLYPEGTRSAKGVIGAFRSGIGRLVAEFPGIPVIPTALKGTDKVLPKDSMLPRSYPVCVRFGKPLCDLHADMADKVSWRAVAAEVRAAVIRLQQTPEES
jgi:1-acyl-sn-glycerol-3-phosphate acyltransferase